MMRAYAFNGARVIETEKPDKSFLAVPQGASVWTSWCPDLHGDFVSEVEGCQMRCVLRSPARLATPLRVVPTGEFAAAGGDWLLSGPDATEQAGFETNQVGMK